MDWNLTRSVTIYKIITLCVCVCVQIMLLSMHMHGSIIDYTAISVSTWLQLPWLHIW